MSIDDRPFESLSRGTLGEHLRAAQQLAREERVLPALIMGWATLEAVGRTLLPSRFAKAQSPGRLVDVLAAHGQLSPNEAERLRLLAQTRNRAVHGAFQISVEISDLEHFLGLIGRIINELPIDYTDRGEADPLAERTVD